MSLSTSAPLMIPTAVRRARSKSHVLALACTLAAAWLLAAAWPAQAADYHVGPTPDWVEPQPLDLTPAATQAQVHGGMEYLLSDMQLKAGPGPATRYVRMVMRATQTEGLDAVAHLEIGFDPAFEELTLHSVDVLRDGRRIAKLPDAQVRVIQREQDLEYRIYDGRKTATLFLDDVRVGDVVEHSFSVRGENPAFGGATFGSSALQWGVPVRSDHTRILVPDGKQITVNRHHGAPAPVERSLPGYREYAWRQTDVSPLPSEDDTPGWYDRHASVEWSQYGSWADVVAWALPLYAPQANLGAEAEAELTRIRIEYDTPQAQAAAVLRFVQSQIRYLGVEVGVGSYVPNAPRKVLERRFGDCKDKTLLMLSMLRKLGIDAHAALVNTESGHGLAQWLPMPSLFDHVLVQARFGADVFWLDPTRDTQYGALDRLHQPDFGMALVVAAGTDALVPMRAADAPVPPSSVLATLDARAGMDAPAKLTVRTTLAGASAEQLRGRLASEPRDELQDGYLDFYAGNYPGIRRVAEMQVQDDRQKNQLVTVESYEIDGFWTKDPDSSVRIATLHGADMADTLPEGATPNRDTPLWRPHPVDFTLTTELLLHETWPIDDETTTIEHPAFRFDRSVEGRDQGRHIVVVDRYRSLADHVLPADLPDYLAKRKEAENSLGFELTWNPDGVTGGGFNLTLAVLVTVLLVGFARLALRVYRHDPPGPSAPLDPALQGIRGWLILPAIGVALTPLVLLVEAAANLGPYSSSQWSALTTPGGDSYHALWAPILLGELVFGVAMLVLSVLLLVMFFQRRRRAPLLYILMLAGSALGLAASVAALQLMPVGELQASAQDWRDLGRALVSCLIWIPYMLRSRRVKSTFIRGYRQAPEALPGPLPLPAG